MWSTGGYTVHTDKQCSCIYIAFLDKGIITVCGGMLDYCISKGPRFLKAPSQFVSLSAYSSSLLLKEPMEKQDDLNWQALNFFAVPSKHMEQCVAIAMSKHTTVYSSNQP